MKIVSKLLVVFLTTFITLPAWNVAIAQTTFDWKDNAPDGNWTQGAQGGRWYKQPNGPDYWDQPDANSNLRFNNNHYNAMTNNVAAGYAVTGLTFGSGNNSSRTIGGNAIGMFDNGGNDPFIVNDSSATHTINLPMTTDSNDALTVNLNGSGGFLFGGVITNNFVMNIGGTTATTNNTVRFNSVVSGAGGMYVNNGNIIVLMDAANSQSGQLTINAGTVRLNGSGDQFGNTSQAIRIGAGASIDLNNVITTVGSIAEEGNSDGGSVSLGSGTLTVTADSLNLFQGSITGTNGSLVKQGSHTLNLYGTQSYSGSTSVENGVLSTSVAMSTTAVTVTGGTFATTAANLLGDSVGVTINGGTYSVGGSDTIGVLSGSGGQVSIANGTTLTTSFDSSSNSYQGVLTGAGALTKSGSGSLTLSGGSANSSTGLTTVSGGTLNLNKTAGFNAIAGAVRVESNAVLLLSASNQVDSSDAGDTVTLSGGTIQRASGVSEVFGALSVTGASTINYGSTAGSSFLQFGSVTGGNNLTISNFKNGNQFRFAAADFSAGQTVATSFSFSGSDPTSYSFSSGTFTITAIPEPSTYVAAAGLLAVFFWPVRRRMIKDLKSILGLRPTGRERIEAYRNV